MNLYAMINKCWMVTIYKTKIICFSLEKELNQ